MSVKIPLSEWPEIWRLRTEERWTLQQVADQYGVTRQRIHQIVMDMAMTDDQPV